MAKVLILTDIFGKSYFSKNLLAFDEYFVLDPYADEFVLFEDEKEAYNKYIRLSGHDKYLQRAQEFCLKEKIEVIIGFSAGGSIAWRLSDLNIPSLKKVISFYPSQIRNHLDISPKVEVNIIFAKKEHSFDTQEIVNFLKKKGIEELEISDFDHGFMNKNSKNFNQKAFEKYKDYLKGKLQSLTL
ncbi:dienelactone hydrolase family protein [Halarcobacter sp.]|uniref:dienelactone hydrolase family protein n=1 Tax=Halarcobacter sp. TaxID=2321133 RepID=UPI003A94FD45